MSWTTVTTSYTPSRPWPARASPVSHQSTVYTSPQFAARVVRQTPITHCTPIPPAVNPYFLPPPGTTTLPPALPIMPSPSTTLPPWAGAQYNALALAGICSPGVQFPVRPPWGTHQTYATRLPVIPPWKIPQNTPATTPVIPPAIPPAFQSRIDVEPASPLSADIEAVREEAIAARRASRGHSRRRYHSSDDDFSSEDDEDITSDDEPSFNARRVHASPAAQSQRQRRRLPPPHATGADCTPFYDPADAATGCLAPDSLASLQEKIRNPTTGVYDQRRYISVEHCAASHMAELFGDSDAMRELAGITTAGQDAVKLIRDIKHNMLGARANQSEMIGRWVDAMEPVYRKASALKFGQDASLRDALLRTGDVTLVYAHPYDDRLGAGCDADGVRDGGEKGWNLYGCILMELREVLRSTVGTSFA
ncbi:hypothetical protein BV25DRAFT_1917022 [Artomyces pyxidatus]|uniref:Uncharacterized protein n=1 Tax=Artomyces pyxidatus TaxID=48021 RepID=A0ACB8SY40_9AGAM|nr:hypothetical protein BV25DRAFT_1917022 [Artomyces pyxidatus]